LLAKFKDNKALN